MKDVDKIINKSLDEIDELIEGLNKSNSEDNDIKKSEEPEVAPEEVSDDIPEGEEGGEGEDSEPSVEEGPEVDTDEDEEDTGDGEVEKSLDTELNSNTNVRKALEVSEFLQEFVKSMDTIISDLRKSVQDNNDTLNKSITGSNNLLAKSLQGLVKSNKAMLEVQSDLSKSLDSIMDRVETLEKQPVVRKSVANAKPIEKSFCESLGMKKESTKLTKSQAVNKLTKSFEEGNADLKDDILALESTGNFDTLSNEAKSILEID